MSLGVHSSDVDFGPFVGQASSENAKAVGMLAETMAKTGWKLACKQGTGSNSGASGGGLGGAKRMYSTSSRVGTSGNVVLLLNGCKVHNDGVVFFSLHSDPQR